MDIQTTTILTAQTMHALQIKEESPIIMAIIQNSIIIETKNPIHVVLKVTMNLVAGAVDAACTSLYMVIYFRIPIR